jgi:hypothetical protein
MYTLRHEVEELGAELPHEALLLREMRGEELFL